MTLPPLSAIVLGLAGMIPFVYGVAMIFAAPGSLVTFGFFPENASGGIQMLERFGVVILGFMGGCLWGFASAGGRRPSFAMLGLASVPAAFAFAAVQDDPAMSCLWLAFGYVVLQAIDVIYRRVGLAPDYWLTLRLPLTAAVMACLLVGASYG